MHKSDDDFLCKTNDRIDNAVYAVICAVAAGEDAKTQFRLPLTLLRVINMWLQMSSVRTSSRKLAWRSRRSVGLLKTSWKISGWAMR